MTTRTSALRADLDDASLLLRPLVPAVSSPGARPLVPGVPRARPGDGAGLGFRRIFGKLLDFGWIIAIAYAVPLAVVVLPIALLVRLVVNGLGALPRDRMHSQGSASSPSS